MRVQHVWFPNQLKNNINTAKKNSTTIKNIKGEYCQETAYYIFLIITIRTNISRCPEQATKRTFFSPCSLQLIKDKA